MIILLNTGCIKQTKEHVGGAWGPTLELTENIVGEVLVMDAHSVQEWQLCGGVVGAQITDSEPFGPSYSICLVSVIFKWGGS